MDYKNTLLLPKTDFPMRAELPKREPGFLAAWREQDIYGQIMAARREAGNDPATTFILHDGPPFANGDAHMGHALNMVLKDIVLKYHNMSGHYSPFVPGWDCHGLPIEHKVMKDLGAAENDPVKIREKCDATARHWIGVQSEQFQRLGVFGDWANPYKTLDPAYEAETLRVFATLVEKNLVYQGLRPVLWSTGCQTALAEAEIEYKEKVDPAIYVKFPLAASEKFPELKDASLLIWTTTPWTLPANLAVAVSPNLDYALYEIAGHRVLLTTGLTSVVAAAVPSGGSDAPTLLAGPWKGSDLVGLTYTHPFLDDGRTRQIFAADFVTADAGTGLVHIAPGHGQDDYQLGKQHALPILAPVDDRGCLTAEFLPANAPDDVKALVGQYVFKANPLVIEILKSRNRLFVAEDYRHDYPHCWRSKTPIVFRAVKQWFIKMDEFRQQALDEIGKVNFIPESGRNRIHGAVQTRPDWCISRQRTWGIPIPVFFGEGEQPLLSAEVVRKFAGLVEKDGAGIWFSRTADELAPALGLPLGLKKGRDTLDVWIDSGTSWAAVVAKRPEFLGRKADLYLEGSDQHRGWFQSSLLTSVAATGAAPYKSILTHGFIVNPDGTKFSKSDGAVNLLSLINQHGADVIRLWVASQNFQGDITVSPDIFTQVADSYRSIRNTLRILLANLHGFDPESDKIGNEGWTELDKYIYASSSVLYADAAELYRTYQFSQIYHQVSRFCSVELSALYIDCIKDRLYCSSKKSPGRRAAQTVLFAIFERLVKLIAPIIPFTADEAWQLSGRKNSIHLESSLNEAIPDLLLHKSRKEVFPGIYALRSEVNEKLEEARRNKLIGKSLEACVEVGFPDMMMGFGPGVASDEANLEFLEELFIVSKVRTSYSQDRKLHITVTLASDHGMKKCVRCWKYWDHIGSDAAHPELCERCTKVVLDWKE